MKPLVLDDYDNAPLHVVLMCYPFFRQNPRAWLRGRHLSQRERRMYPDIAHALGQPLEPASNPHIINLPT
ncbi:MAG: hypothetical protein AAFV98_21720, partial [Chloroflexota bacterium]